MRAGLSDARVAWLRFAVAFPAASTQGGRASGPAGIGLVLPTFPQGGAVPSAAALSALCRDAEAAGAAGLWACDHLFWHGPSVECLTAVSVAALATSRCLVGSCVLQLPLRRPVVVAKTAASLQHVASGRVVLGVGVGTHPGEYEAAGVDYHERGRLLDAGIAELRTAWAKTDDRYVQLPTPDPIALWSGGSSPAARRRAATLDGWVPLFVPPEDYGDELRSIRDAAGRAGREPAAVAGAVVAFVSIGADRTTAGAAGVGFMASLYGLPERAFARHLLAGPAVSVANDLARWVEHGAQHVVVFVADDRPLAQFEELVGAFAELDAATPAPARAGHPTGSVR